MSETPPDEQEDEPGPAVEETAADAGLGQAGQADEGKADEGKADADAAEADRGQADPGQPDADAAEPDAADADAVEVNAARSGWGGPQMTSRPSAWDAPSPTPPPTPAMPAAPAAPTTATPRPSAPEWPLAPSPPLAPDPPPSAPQPVAHGSEPAPGAASAPKAAASEPASHPPPVDRVGRALLTVGMFLAGFLLTTVILVIAARTLVATDVSGWIQLYGSFLIATVPAVALALSRRTRPLGLGGVLAVIVCALAVLWFAGMFHTDPDGGAMPTTHELPAVVAPR
ncbi:MAG: hypothetical protein QOK43_500 [Acidimicrobiaceae bacterium]|nr:hypothetical protein [Acidimicrobiaceae bacterium]